MLLHRKLRRIVFCAALLSVVSACASEPQTEARRSLKIADDEIASGNPHAALKLMQARYAKTPNDVPTLIRLGEANAALARNTPAQILFEKAVRLDPSSEEARMGLVKADLKIDPHKALSELQVFLAHHPATATLLSDLGVAYDLCGDAAKAQASYRDAMRLDPVMLAPQANLGLSLALSGHASEATALLRPLALSSDSTPKIRQNFAIAEVLAGDDTSARRILAADFTAGKIEGLVASYKELAFVNGR